MGDVRKKKNESIDEFNERASKYYFSNGFHIKEIADKLGIDQIEAYNYATTGRKITTNEERAEMINLFNKGYSYTAIGRIFNKSRTCVRDRIKRPAKSKCKNNNEIDYKSFKKMKDMEREGASMTTISNEIGISMSSVRYRLRNSVSINHYKRVGKTEINQYIKLYKNGKTCSEIAKMYNRGRTTIYRYLKKAGYIEDRFKK